MIVPHAPVPTQSIVHAKPDGQVIVPPPVILQVGVTPALPNVHPDEHVGGHVCSPTQ
jgi:hypothetical protein